MIRPNDLGGVPGFGPIEIEPDEPPFHHEWERRVLAIPGAARNALPCAAQLPGRCLATPDRPQRGLP